MGSHGLPITEDIMCSRIHKTVHLKLYTGLTPCSKINADIDTQFQHPHHVLDNPYADINLILVSLTIVLIL